MYRITNQKGTIVIPAVDKSGKAMAMANKLLELEITDESTGESTRPCTTTNVQREVSGGFWTTIKTYSR